MPLPRFTRIPHEADPHLVVSRCTDCNSIVGAAESEEILKTLEERHACKKAPKSKTLSECQNGTVKEQHNRPRSANLLVIDVCYNSPVPGLIPKFEIVSPSAANVVMVFDSVHSFDAVDTARAAGKERNQGHNCDDADRDPDPRNSAPRGDPRRLLC